MIYVRWFDSCLRVEYRRRRNGKRGVEGRVGELIGLEGGEYICVRNEVGWCVRRRRV